MNDKSSNEAPENDLFNQVEQGLAGLMMCLTVAAGLTFVVWFHWAVVMRFASF